MTVSRKIRGEDRTRRTCMVLTRCGSAEGRHVVLLFLLRPQSGHDHPRPARSDLHAPPCDALIAEAQWPVASGMYTHIHISWRATVCLFPRRGPVGGHEQPTHCDERTYMRCINMHAQDDGIDIRSVPLARDLPLPPRPPRPHGPQAKISLRTIRYMLLFLVCHGVCGGGGGGGRESGQDHVCPLRRRHGKKDRQDERKATSRFGPLARCQRPPQAYACPAP